MRIVITVGLLIVFITTFFILFIGNALLNKSLICENVGTDDIDCSLDAHNFEMILSFVIVLSFILADVAAIYLMITTWKF